MTQTLYPNTPSPASVTSGLLDPQLIQLATVNVTSANILAMNGAPVTVLAAPGAGKAIIVDSILFEMTTTSTQYANGGVVQFVYHGGSVQVTGNTIPAATVTATAGTTNTLVGSGSPSNGIVVAANTAIDITNATAAFITGTGTAVLKIWYSIITL